MAEALLRKIPSFQQKSRDTIRADALTFVEKTSGLHRRDLVTEAMPAHKKRKPLRWLVKLLFLILPGLGLQHIPGSYTIDDFQDDYELTSPEGIALMALSDASVHGELYFKEPTRHRISRNAEILVPADTELKVYATTTPFVKEEEVILKPATLQISSDRALTFVYRNVTVAKAKILQIDPDDTGGKVKAVGQYRVLSALATAHRYARQKEVRRDYKIPDKATLDFRAEFHPDHDLKPAEGLSLFTGSEPGMLLLENAVWKDGSWQQGRLNVSFPFSDVEPGLNVLLKMLLPEPIEIGSAFDLDLKRIYDLTFKENFLDLYIDGTVSYAKSEKITHIFKPSFKAHVGVEFHLPRQTLLQHAVINIGLKNVYSFDINRSNPVFDKIVRNTVRNYREEASFRLNVEEEIPEISLLPGDLYIESLGFKGNEQGHPILFLELEFLPKDSAGSHEKRTRPETSSL